MAVLRREGDELVLELSVLEKAEAAHGDVRVPVAAVSGIEVLDEAMAAVPALKAPGARVPGWMAVGTFYSGLGEGRTKAFVVVHHDTRKAVRVSLSGARYDELIVGSDEPEALAAEVAAPVSLR